LLARLFLDQLTLIPDSAFHIIDTNFPGGELSRRYPDNSEVLDFSKTGGHVRLFDQIMGYPHQDYIIDLQSEFMVKFFDILNEIEFASELIEQKMRIIVYYIVDATESSFEMAANIYSKTPDVEFLPVYNHAIASPFDLKMISRTMGEVEPLSEVVFPKLSVDLVNFINAPQFDLSKFIMGSHVHDDSAVNSELMALLKDIRDNRTVDSKGFIHVY